MLNNYKKENINYTGRSIDEVDNLIKLEVNDCVITCIFNPWPCLPYP